MKATTTLLATALAAAGLMAAGTALADGPRGGSGGHGAGGSRGGGHWQGHGAGGNRGGGHWQGHGNGGHVRGDAGWRGGGHWHGRGASVHHGWRGGGHWGHGHWVGSRWSGGPRWSFYFGVPVFWGAWDPWYSPYYYPRETVVYREVLPETEIVETIREVPADGPAPAPAVGAPPSSGPLSMSYCASAKAYFPQVRSCPEGWSATPPTR